MRQCTVIPRIQMLRIRPATEREQLNAARSLICVLSRPVNATYAQRAVSTRRDHFHGSPRDTPTVREGEQISRYQATIKTDSRIHPGTIDGEPPSAACSRRVLTSLISTSSPVPVRSALAVGVGGAKFTWTPRSELHHWTIVTIHLQSL